MASIFSVSLQMERRKSEARKEGGGKMPNFTRGDESLILYASFCGQAFFQLKYLFLFLKTCEAHEEVFLH